MYPVNWPRLALGPVFIPIAPISAIAPGRGALNPDGLTDKKAPPERGSLQVGESRAEIQPPSPYRIAGAVD